MKLLQKHAKILILFSILVGSAVAFQIFNGQDGDNDGMDDGWEAVMGLDPTDPNDDSADPDADLLTNFQESGVPSDPFVEDTDFDMWPDGLDSDPVSSAVMYWGDPSFTTPTNSIYNYVGPAWWTNQTHRHVGGQWFNHSWTSLASEPPPDTDRGPRLEIGIDRSLLATNLNLDIEYWDFAGAELEVSLYDTGTGAYVATNLFGNLCQGVHDRVRQTYALPLADHPSADQIRIERHKGHAQVYTTMLRPVGSPNTLMGFDVPLHLVPEIEVDAPGNFVQPVFRGFVGQPGGGATGTGCPGGERLSNVEFDTSGDWTVHTVGGAYSYVGYGHSYLYGYGGYGELIEISQPVGLCEGDTFTLHVNVEWNDSDPGTSLDYELLDDQGNVVLTIASHTLTPNDYDSDYSFSGTAPAGVDSFRVRWEDGNYNYLYAGLGSVSLISDAPGSGGGGSGGQAASDGPQLLNPTFSGSASPLAWSMAYTSNSYADFDYYLYGVGYVGESVQLEQDVNLVAGQTATIEAEWYDNWETYQPLLEVQLLDSAGTVVQVLGTIQPPAYYSGYKFDSFTTTVTADASRLRISWTSDETGNYELYAQLDSFQLTTAATPSGSPPSLYAFNQSFLVPNDTTNDTSDWDPAAFPNINRLDTVLCDGNRPLLHTLYTDTSTGQTWEFHSDLQTDFLRIPASVPAACNPSLVEGYTVHRYCDNAVSDHLRLVPDTCATDCKPVYVIDPLTPETGHNDLSGEFHITGMYQEHLVLERCDGGALMFWSSNVSSWCLSESGTFESSEASFYASQANGPPDGGVHAPLESMEWYTSSSNGLGANLLHGLPPPGSPGFDSDCAIDLDSNWHPREVIAPHDCEADSDGDGMYDVWETANGLDAYDPADATLDSDGDGWSNLIEFHSGLDPQTADGGGGPPGSAGSVELVVHTPLDQ